MMFGNKNKSSIPHEDIEVQIANFFSEIEKDIESHKIINAYYNIQKSNKLISQLPESFKAKNDIKEKYKWLNNKLNREILKFIDNEGRYNGLY